MTKYLIRLAPVVVIAWQAFAGTALAQQPAAAAITAAREVVDLKGGNRMFDPVISSVVDRTEALLIQTNPQLSKDLTEVGQQLRTEYAKRRDELITEAAKFYAQRFTEPELKELAAFYRSALGKKMLVQEPQVLDETFNYVQRQWAPRIGEEVMNRFRAEMKKKGHNL